MRYVREERAKFCQHCRLRARNIYAYTEEERRIRIYDSYAQSTVPTKVPITGASRSLGRRPRSLSLAARITRAAASSTSSCALAHRRAGGRRALRLPL